ncbi:hypothetical protein IT774_07590 [Salinimonas marina]|uniref:Uncharacterized protein n=1 Tax=Salinimonas marina TaxID=2785918 RepID=A0A7S9DZV4_9ALTE|nr:hypothetical protein [Salinimonas marina]QPG06957.1 hypothetical protein IT774_07590 [Salinimonas marina]
MTLAEQVNLPERVAYIECAHHENAHVMTLTEGTFRYSLPDISCGQLTIIIGDEEIIPAKWNFVTDDAIEDGVHSADKFTLHENYVG